MGSECRGPVWSKGPDRSRSGPYFTEVKARLYAAFHWSMTPLTFFDSTLGCLSHSHGMAAAVLTTALSMLPKALARLAGSAMRSPLSIIALILGSSSCGQFALFDEEIERPSNGTLNIVNGSL